MNVAPSDMEKARQHRVGDISERQTSPAAKTKPKHSKKAPRKREAIDTCTMA
jgi:hypothetical protein